MKTRKPNGIRHRTNVNPGTLAYCVCPGAAFQKRRPLVLAHVIEKLRGGLHARHQQMIPRARAVDVEQMTLGVIHLLQIGVVANRLDAFLQRNDFVVARHNRYGAELQALGEVHCADRDMAADRLDVFIENLED